MQQRKQRSHKLIFETIKKYKQIVLCIDIF